jgi:hypothetical protein
MVNIRAVMIPAVLAIAFLPGTSSAAGNIRFGKLELHPFLSLQEIFSDNIYSTASDQKRDRISVVMPGIKARFPFSVHLMEAEYFANLRRYDEFRGERTDDHHARGSLDLRFGSRLGLSVSDEFNKGHEPRSSSATGFIETFRTNEAKGSAIYQLAGRSKVQIDYGQTAYNFQRSDFRDRDERLVAGYLYYRVMPKTSVFVEYDHRTIDFVPETTVLDSTMDSALLGVTWEATAKSKGTIKAGRTDKDFEGPANRDFTLWELFVDLNHMMSEGTTITVKGLRKLNETNLLGTTYFITSGLSAELRHDFGAKLAGLARFSYGKDRFSNAVPPDTDVRNDRTLFEGAGVRYLLREWFELGADYNHRARNSNIDANDFREHQYVLSANVTF